MRISKKLAALGALFVLVAVAVAGCGGSSSVGSGAVASVAGNPISMRAWKHYMYLQAKEEAAEEEEEEDTDTPVIIVDDPPKFTSCISMLTADKYSASDAKVDCGKEFIALNTDVLKSLISDYWYQGTLHKLGLSVSAKQVEAELNKEKKKYFDDSATKYKEYLSESGYTNADLLWLTHNQLVEEKLVKHFAKKVTASDISAYYSQHPSDFVTAASRDAHLLDASSEAKATAAYKALKSGASWKSVVKRYSVSSSSSDDGGLLTGITDSSSNSDELETAALKAIFDNPVGKLVGPTKGTLGWYVTEVTKTVAAKKTAFDAATKKKIKSTLADDNETSAEEKVEALASKDFASETQCRSGYAVKTYCANYSSAKPSATLTTAATTTKTSTTKTKTSKSSTTKTSSKSSKSSSKSKKSKK